MIKNGFTLIELLVVVLIIGILVAVALPQYKIAVEKARVSQLFLILKTLAEAQEVYYYANSRYASSLSDLDVSIEDTHPEENELYLSNQSYLLKSASSFTSGYVVGFTNHVQINFFLIHWTGTSGGFLPGSITCAAPISDKTGQTVCQNMGGILISSNSGCRVGKQESCFVYRL